MCELVWDILITTYSEDVELLDHRIDGTGFVCLWLFKISWICHMHICHGRAVSPISKAHWDRSENIPRFLCVYMPIVACLRRISVFRVMRTFCSNHNSSELSIQAGPCKNLWVAGSIEGWFGSVMKQNDQWVQLYQFSQDILQFRWG